MKLISPGSRVKFHTVKPIISPDHDPWKTKFQAIFLSGTVQEDNGNRVTIWTDDSRTFRVPYEYRTPPILSPILPYPCPPSLLMNLFLKVGALHDT